ncbi:MAG: AzlD domain-containing protein [Leptolyngbya sp. SIO4C5]|uniref:AzlD domain-containing protein n=1 Tax=Sphaerothrix gracilis TaxID=3151835 RepID=UPI0013C1ECBD|nr:AzlD domain-containing protein [Leptolyngbya sp. SIO4C5]
MMPEIALIGGMALVTFLIRYPLLAMSGRFTLSPRLLQALNYVPPAVLTAIVVPAVLVEENAVWLGLDNPRLIGAIAALAVGLWRKNLLLTIIVGMGAFLLWQAVV